MSNRVHAGARIPEKIRELHAENVREKWGREDVYLGTEAEMAIREYLDQDDFVDIEAELKETCASLGCSTEKIKSSRDSLDAETKPRAMWRIHPELKEELKAYAKSVDKTYSDTFALALREYWTNSRSERIEQLLDRLETAIDPWKDSIGSDGVNASVTDRRTAEIAMELPDWPEIPRPKIEQAISDVTSDSDYNHEKYTPLVAEYKGLEKHPLNDVMFITHEMAEEKRQQDSNACKSESIFEQSYEQLAADDCDLRVCARLFEKAKSMGGTAKMEHSDIWDEFDREPSRTTVYNMMDRISERNGYSAKRFRGSKRLRVEVRKVDDIDVAETLAEETEDNAEETEDKTESSTKASDELDALATAERVVE